MHLYDDQFREEHDFAVPTAPSKVLVIASTGRCGSHMLGHALYKTGRFGFPLEYVNPNNLAEWKRRLKKRDVAEVIAELQRRRTSPNGVFAIKVHYPHVRQFGGFAGMVRAFPNAYYVLLTRGDVLSQAVSLSIAMQTGVWIAGQRPISDNPQYRFADVDKYLRQTILNNASWRYVLSASRCRYIEMDFDTVRGDLVRSIEQIADFMGVEVANEDIPRQQVTKRQGGSRNEEWAERFAGEFNKSTELLDRVGSDRWGVARLGRLVRRLFGGGA